MEKVDWSNVRANQAWVDKYSAQLTPELIDELVRLRGYPSRNMVADAIEGLGWHQDSRSWVLPMRDVHGTVTHAKLWRPFGGRWITAGFNRAREAEKQGHSIGRLWGINRIIRKLDEFQEAEKAIPGGGFLWVVAGEHDAIMLSCYGWLATTFTQGETSAPAGEVFLREMGKQLGVADKIFSSIRGVIVCFDTDYAGDSGCLRTIGTLERLIDEGELEVGEEWSGVRGLNLRKLPGWEDDEGHIGWDISDLVKWSKTAGQKVGGLLIKAAQEATPGLEAGEEEFGIQVATATGLNSVMIRDASLHTMDVEALLQFGVAWARTGSRGEGAYHMGYKALRNGWQAEELIGEGTPEIDKQFCAAVDAQIPKGDGGFKITEFRAQFMRSFLNVVDQENLCDDASNEKRMARYFPFIKWFPIGGEKGQYMWWSGSRWVPDAPKAWDQTLLVADYINEEGLRARKNGDHSVADMLWKWSKQSRSHAKRQLLLSAIKKSAIFRPNWEQGEDWNGDGDVLATPIGVLDLNTGKYLPKDVARDKFCSMSTNGSVLLGDEGVKKWGEKWWEAHRMWLSILSDWHESAEVITMLQDIAGLALSGHLDEHLYIFQGSGRSGKSAFLDALRHALGDYAYTIGSEIITKSGGGAGSKDTNKNLTVAQMSHKRMVRIDETGGQLLNVDLIKWLTGETTLQGRHHYGNFEGIANHGTYFMTTNAEPNFRGEQSEALHDRVFIIPWNHTFVSASRISNDEYRSGAEEHTVMVARPDLKNVLMGQSDNVGDSWPMMPDVVLTWAYHGLVRVMSNGGAISVADVARIRTEAMWDESDPVESFFIEGGLFAKGGETIITTPGLYENMYAWAKINDHDFAESIETPRKMGGLLRRMAKRGFEAAGKTTTGLWAPEPGKQYNCWKVPYTHIGSRKE